jgi:hypothetical protein
MHDAGINDLVQKEIDCPLDPAERAALESATKRDPEFAEERASMLAIGTALDDLPDLDPPHDFARNVMDAIRSRPPHAETPRVAYFPLQARRRAVFAASGIAAAAIIALLFLPYVSEKVDGNHTGGAMVRPLESLSSDSGGIRLDAAGRDGAIRFGETVGGFTVYVDASGEPGDSLELTFDDEAFANITVSGADVVRQGAGAVVVALRGGPATIALERRSPAEASVGVSFRTPSGAHVQRTVKVSATTNL